MGQVNRPKPAYWQGCPDEAPPSFPASDAPISSGGNPDGWRYCEALPGHEGSHYNQQGEWTARIWRMFSPAEYARRRAADQ
jgi:hypothetical protein